MTEEEVKRVETEVGRTLVRLGYEKFNFCLVLLWAGKTQCDVISSLTDAQNMYNIFGKIALSGMKEDNYEKVLTKATVNN